MINKRTKFMFFISVALLQACGGDDEAATEWNYPALEGNTGSVSAPFVSTDARYFFKSSIGSSISTAAYMGVPVSFVQEGSGAVTEIVNSSGTLLITVPTADQVAMHENMLPYSQIPALASPIVKEISGDAYFAMGRWAVGSATDINKTGLLFITFENPFDEYFYLQGMHYLLMNKLSALPATGTMNCDESYFTQGTYTEGVFPSITKPVTITGTAELSFDNTGAHFSINLHAAMSHIDYAVTGDQTYSGTMTTPSSIPYTNLSAVMLGEGGNGSYLLGGHYKITTNAGTGYHGMMVFRCQ